MDKEKIRPSRWLYVLAGVIFIGGWVGFAVILFTSLMGIGNKMQQVVVPGRSTITLHDTGSYSIFHEYRSVVGNKVYSTGKELPGLECVLVSKSTGASVPLTPASSSETYEMGGRSGISIFEFNIHDPGEYELSASYAGGQQGPEAVLAVGHDFTLGIITTVFGSLAVVFGCIAISIALAVFTAIKRSNAKKRLRAVNQGPITPI